jgi:hypothetical protein
MRAQAKPPRRKWPWIIVGVVVVVVAGLVAYALYAVATNKSVVEPTPEPTRTEATPVDAAPTGCLGGDGLDAATLLAAQAKASHGTSGAVEVAAALMRWGYRYPYPSPEDAQTASDSLISSEAPDSFRDLVAFFNGEPNLSGGLVADKTEYHLSTVTGVWFVDEEAPDQVTASIGSAFVVDGQLSSSLKASTTVTLRWEDGAWRADQLAGIHTTEELFEIGTPFTGGC